MGLAVILVTGASVSLFIWALVKPPAGDRPGLPPRKSLFLVGTGIGVYIFTFSLLSIREYDGYNMAMLDFGNIDQAIWNTLQGRIILRPWI
jgi:hypothetical protein